MSYKVIAALAVAAALFLGGCAQYRNTRGVEVSWEPAAVDDLVRGETRRSEVLSRLGPPSQVIALGDETVLYYLNERSEGEGLLLVVYNRFVVHTGYDRAVFFFDAQDRLTDYSAWVRRQGDG